MRKFRVLVSLLLLLGMVAWSDLASICAQDKRKEPLQPKTETPKSIEKSEGRMVQEIKGVQMPISIDPKSPLKELLPSPPSIERIAGPIRANDLSRVPEVRFQSSQDDANVNSNLSQIAQQIAKINHLNSKKTDGFLEALREARPDLRGLPFAMGDACGTSTASNCSRTMASFAALPTSEASHCNSRRRSVSLETGKRRESSNWKGEP